MTDVDTGAVEASAASAGAEGLAAGAERPERRHLTVMFCDLARSTSLSRELDPEDYRLVLRAYQRACAAVFSRYGGFVSKYEGDGIRVLYGFPSAHEDNAERAVRAGLEIAAAVPAIRLPRGAADLGESLSVRVSIATSMVVVGETIGSGVSKEMPVWGEAPNLAARLKARSQPNTVVVCEATKELLGNAFDLDDLGSRHVEGYSEPVPAWRVVSAREPESRFEALGRGSAGRFVGRRGELADMRRLWERAKGGDGNVVLIAGEAGIGKSRLLEEFTKRLEPRGSIVLRYQCSPFHVHSALYPLITNLARIARDEVDDSPSAMLDRLEQWLEFRPEESREELMPLFAELLSIPVPEGRYRDAPLAPEQRRRRTMAALEQQLAWLAEGLPLLLLVEDVHWADPSTLELLERCIARIAGIRALLVVTHRPEFTRAWQESEHVRRLALEPLDAAQSRELIESLSGGDTLQEGVVEELVAKADGVPLYLEELATAVIDGGPVPGEGRRRGGARRDIPASLQDSLLARLDQLGSAKETAELGAVIGRAFSVELLEAISTRTRAQLEGALARLAELGLVVHAGAGRYHFRHALIREAAYGCLLKSRRQQLHGEVARALEARFPDSVARHPEILARHCREAGQLARAVDYAYLAAKQALSRSANAEAIEHIDNALALIDRVPETDPDAMPEPARSERRLELLIALGTAYRAVKGFASSRTMHAFERALSLCKRGIGGSQELAAALRGLYTCHYVRGDHRVSRAMGAEVLEQAQRAGEPARLIAGHYMLGASMFWQGEFAAARREFEDALRLYRKVVPQDRELSEQVDLKVTLMNHLAWALWMLGHPEQAMQTISASLKAAHDLPQPFTQAMALFVHGAIHSSCHGGRADARRLASLRAISESYGLAFPAACARVLEGQASIADGETRRGIERIGCGRRSGPAL